MVKGGFATMSKIKLSLNFWKNVKKTSSCWLWLGRKNNGGYGTWGPKSAHRLSFEVFEKIKKGFVIDHICKNRLCVNPSHLRQVTLTENTLNNSLSRSALNKNKTHCHRGHEFTDETTYRYPSTRNPKLINRYCKTCKRLFRKDGKTCKKK